MTNITRDSLLAECNKLLRPELFRDYGPNGLQVAGRENIGSIISAVTASQVAIDHAIAQGADALLVHHGIFWGKGETRLIGTLRDRVAAILNANLNLIAWHLPLDAHPRIGNNAELARLLGIGQRPQAKPTDLLALGDLPSPVSAPDWLARLRALFGEQANCYGDCNKSIQSIAWCTGAGADYIEQAADQGVDAFITGEVSERHFHLAAELGVCLFTAGHHASERYGVQALGKHLTDCFSIQHEFFDQPNPL